MNEPMEVHLRDCVDSTHHDVHVVNGVNNFCMCSCHQGYHPKEGEEHYYMLTIPAQYEWVKVEYVPPRKKS